MKVATLVPAARERLVTISNRARLTDAAARLGTGHTDLIVVCNEGGKMVGVVSKTDIVSRISLCEGHACTANVASVMTRDVTFCQPDDTLQSAWMLMKDNGYLHIPIIDQNNCPLGTLHARDALQALLVEAEYEEELLRDYVMGIGYH